MLSMWMIAIIGATTYVHHLPAWMLSLEVVAFMLVCSYEDTSWGHSTGWLAMALLGTSGYAISEYSIALPVATIAIYEVVGV